MARRLNNLRRFFSDPDFQTELNLQDIRRFLVFLLDEREVEECVTCNRLRCRCPPSSPQPSTSGARQGFPQAPPPEALPRPRWAVYRSHRRQAPEPDPVLERHYDDLLRWVQESHPGVTRAGPDMTFPMDGSVNNDINMSWPAHQRSIWYQPPRVEPLPEAHLVRVYRQFCEYYLHVLAENKPQGDRG
ncbi:uncharacterized protein LOC114350873 isoform X2 [Ostrinia furnacalis]|uniref:uncharacterized protein LOC114350873 isoform X1 n=1 Tax=Ostrinia furnacalis TaxID=93504 RepID=UPI00103BFF5F|nr:uncharacterized protein LOC114350873 isoform X1 [Ostrinia furnacalis]XP_028157629.1 uncharacterized protein LOC114350873 isoform X2 [Ostrinia furnacalis]